jgi:hypothetical protein
MDSGIDSSPIDCSFFPWSSGLALLVSAPLLTIDITLCGGDSMFFGVTVLQIYLGFTSCRNGKSAVQSGSVAKRGALRRHYTCWPEVPGLAEQVLGVPNSNCASRDLHIHFADLGFDFAEDRVFAQGAQVRILGEPFEIPVAEGEGLLERRRGGINFADERVAAGEVVEYERVLGFEPGQFFVHLEALIETAALGVMIAEELKSLDIFRIAPHESLHELNLNIQVFRVPAFRFFSGTNLFRHTTVELFPR